MQSISSNVHLNSMFIQCPVLVFTDSNQASWILIAFLVLLSSLSFGGLVVSIFACQPKGRGIEPRREPMNFSFIFKCSRIPSVRKFFGRSRWESNPEPSAYKANSVTIQPRPLQTKNHKNELKLKFMEKRLNKSTSLCAQNLPGQRMQHTEIHSTIFA